MNRARQPLSVVLLVVGCLFVFLGTAAFYAASEILEPDPFADRAVSTLDNSEVRDLAARELTQNVVEKVDPDLITAQPIIEAAAGAVIDTPAFKTALRQGIVSAHSAVFKGNDEALVTVANIGVLVSEALKQFQPNLAKNIPPGLDSTLVDIGKGKAATDAAQVADDIRILGLALTPIGILLLFGSVMTLGDRRRGVIRVGAGLAAVGLAAVVVLGIAHGIIRAQVEDNSDKLALDAFWGSFVGPLRNWYLVLGGLGVVISSAAASALRPYDLGEPLQKFWRRVSTEPESTGKRLLWALGLVIVGLIMVFSPETIVDGLVIIGGAYLLSRAVGTAISLAARSEATVEESHAERKRIAVWTAGGIIVAILASIGLGALLIRGEEAKEAVVADTKGCNGREELCERNLDQVAFGATHNSYAGANYPGFVFPEQDDTIPEQLDAGIRGLWIDTYYGIPGKRVFTQTDRIDPALSAMIKDELGPKFTAAGERIRAQIAKPPADAQSEIFLCHAFCELGAVSAGETFKQIAEFLEKNPREVLIIDLEDYTTPEDTQKLIESTGLVDYIYKGPQGPPWPTLQEMIDSGGRVLLVAEHETGGASWYRPLNPTIQETEFKFKKISEFTCKGGRGKRSDTIFLINHWIDTDPTPKPTNAQKANAKNVLLKRARKCEKQRNRFPNILNVDFYKQGDLFGAVRELNEQPPGQRPAK